jgi:hypothetical protein
VREKIAHTPKEKLQAFPQHFFAIVVQNFFARTILRSQKMVKPLLAQTENPPICLPQQVVEVVESFNLRRMANHAPDRYAN